MPVVDAEVDERALIVNLTVLRRLIDEEHALEATLGVGHLFLCSLLFRTRLIPRFLAVGGLIGYVSLMVGMIAEIFGIHISLMLSFPGIFFEVGLPLWLFIKGFQPEAYSGRAEFVPSPAVRPGLATP